MKQKTQKHTKAKRLKIKIDSWYKCYPSNWKGMIVPDAIKHPAKYSSLLIRRIYAHLLAEGWAVPGDTVLDPFGGVALGALDAMRIGLKWRGVELEKKFAMIGGANIELWNKRYSSMPNWSGDAVLFNGDSRKLLEVLKENKRQTEVMRSSPPFGAAQSGGGIAKSVKGESDYPMEDGLARVKNANNAAAGFGYQGQGETDGNLSTLPITDKGLLDVLQMGVMRSSPPFAGVVGIQDKNFLTPGERGKKDPSKSNDTTYGDSGGNLGSLPATDEGFSLTLSSPPYADSIKSGTGSGFDYSKSKSRTSHKKTDGRESIAVGYGDEAGQLGSMSGNNFEISVSSPPFLQQSGGVGGKASRGMDPGVMARHAAGNKAAEAYGNEQGQLTNLPEGKFDQAISSPPFEGNPAAKDNIKGKNKAVRSNPRTEGEKLYFVDYEKQDSDGNIGSTAGEDFWSAARLIVEQVYLALKPGGHAVWVVKDFVKNKQIVPFCNQWRLLCEAVGFLTLHEHHAELITDNGASHTLEGGQVEHKTASKSFFRRVAEKNAAIKKYWESLKPAKQRYFTTRAHAKLWDHYNGLSAEKLAEKDEEGKPRNNPPLDRSILKEAREMAFSDSGEKLTDWNRETAIDYETVFCMVKPAQ